MKPIPYPPRHPRSGFTLVEMMVALAVLSLLVLLIAQLFTSASQVTRASTVRLDADTEARLVLDRMAADFTWMLRRPDVDFHFVKQVPSGGAPTTAPSDTFFFFSEVPGYYDPVETVPESNVSLVGYRINSTTYQLERLARGLSWDADNATKSGIPAIFLTYDNYAGTSTTLTDYTPDILSTILGNWPNIDQTTYTDAYFHVLGASVFRLEFCYFLKDGTYSVVPAINYAAINANGVPSTTGNTSVSNNLNAGSAPTPSKGSPTYGVGSRWYDSTNNHAYICTSAPANVSNAAVWRPLGMADVQAIVVTIAILDQTSQKLLGSTPSTGLKSITQFLTDPTWNNATGAMSSPPAPTISVGSGATATTPILMAQSWLNTVNGTGGTTFAPPGIPKAAANQVRVYQRFFYLNNNF